MIKVDNVSFSFIDRPFIRNVSFEVGKGEIFGFLGPSGAGKSTLQKILIGLITNYEGSVKILGEEVKNHSSNFYEKIGVDFEFPSFYEKMTARQNLKFFSSLYKRKARDIDELLESVELLNDGDKKVSDFSKGMKSRLGFIKALIHDPEIIFLDEPTSGLDPTNSYIMKEKIIEERNKGKSIIITTHNMQDADELCDRVAFIVNGQVKVIDSPRNFMLHKSTRKVKYSYIKDGNEVFGECLIDKINEDIILINKIKEGKVLTIHSCEPNLGDIFMDITGRNLG